MQHQAAARQLPRGLSKVVFQLLTFFQTHFPCPWVPSGSRVPFLPLLGELLGLRGLCAGVMTALEQPGPRVRARL